MRWRTLEHLPFEEREAVNDHTFKYEVRTKGVLNPKSAEKLLTVDTGDVRHPFSEGKYTTVHVTIWMIWFFGRAYPDYSYMQLYYTV